MSNCHGCPASSTLCSHTSPPVASRGARHVVAIVGPPNSGKSTMFNQLTGMHQKVANFPGVTVEHRIGRAKLDAGREVTIIDLPGVYSLNPRSEDEQVTRDVLMGEADGVPRPDAILLILDSTNLGRHLVLAAPILCLGLPTLVVLNMVDDLYGRGGTVDAELLSTQLGAPVALTNAARGEGIDAVMRFLCGAIAMPEPVQLPVLNDVPKCRQWAHAMGSEAGYRSPAPPLWTRRLDALFLHPVAGPLIFLLVVLGVFQTIFTGAAPAKDGLDWLVRWSGHQIGALIPVGILHSLLIDGVWSGVGSVVVFLPQILVLFLFIGILEDSGYLARAALIADRTMSKVGLQGKSFIPLLSAYACAVPAIMATRTIENKRDRIATILIAPFMTCSARLPVYTLIIAAFLPDKPLLGPVLGIRAMAMFGLYVLGFLAAVVTARALKSSVLKSDRAPFVLEMPPYRWPTAAGLGLRLLDRGRAFLYRAGTVILGVTLLLWALTNFPMHHGEPPALADSYIAHVGHAIEPAIRPLGFDWKIGIGLVSSIAAREVILSTLGTLYGVDPASHAMDLQTALHHDLTPAAAVALLVFFAFALQCASTIAVVRRETNGWRWPALQFAYMTTVAYVSALLVYHLLR